MVAYQVVWIILLLRSVQFATACPGGGGGPAPPPPPPPCTRKYLTSYVGAHCETTNCLLWIRTKEITVLKLNWCSLGCSTNFKIEVIRYR